MSSLSPVCPSNAAPRAVPPVMRRVRRALAAGALAALGAVAEAADPVGVIVAPVTRASFPLAVEAVGTTRANESVDIRPKTTEVLTRIEFDEGQDVAAGAVLARLDDSQVLAAVAAARATLVESDSQYRRSQELFETRAVSESELERLAARRNADRATLDAARARLADTVLRAPFAGRLGLRRVSAGSLVGPDTVITTLDDIDTLKLDFSVPETVLARLRPGLPVVATSAAYPEQTFRGEVTSIDTRVDPVTRTLGVRALLPNPDRLLLPGMFLSVRMLREDVTALKVPEAALVPEQSRQYVFVVVDGVVEKRLVRIGRRRPGSVEIIAGVSEGERVVVEGMQKIRDGSAVAVLQTLAAGEGP